MVQDDGAVWKQKSQLAVRADYVALNSGESVAVEYKIDRATNWTTRTADSTTSSTFSQLLVDNTGGRGREYQIGVNLYATGSTSPTLLGLALLGDVLPEEATF